MISTKATENYISIMANKWNDELYTKNSLELYNKQFRKIEINTSESTSDSVNEINMMTDITTSKPKEVKTVESPKYKNNKFLIPQRMSYAHAETDRAWAFIDEGLYISSIYNSKNSTEVANMNVSKQMSKKYSHNEYSYAEYFFRIFSQSAKKYEHVKQDIKFTEFNIKTVNFETAKHFNLAVNKYEELYAKMHKDKVKFEVAKHKLNMLATVQNYKKFKNLITEYEKCISDITFKLATYENVDRKYNNALILSYQCLIIQAKENLQDAEVEMLSDIKYVKMFDKVETLKDTYKKSLKEVVNYRRNFADYLIYKKIAAYIYINPLNGEKVINGIKWNLKNPSGKLHSKTTLSSLQKAYNVVKFDKINKKLIVNAGL